MKKQGNDKIQKFSLRKYKGIGAASVLLGMMYLCNIPVYAEEITNQSNEVSASGKVSLDKMITLKNSKGSYTLPVWHYYVTDFDGTNSEYYSKISFERVESEIRTQGIDSFQDTKTTYITKDGTELKSEENIDIPVNDKKVSSSTMEYKIRGRFGKRYEGKFYSLNDEVVNKIKESDKTIFKDGEQFHKIDTIVEKHEGTTKETTFNDITVHANPANLHNDDGSIRYDEIKEGSRVWLVSETSENHYEKYVLVNKPSTADNTWAIEAFKKGEAKAKEFTKENVIKDGDIQEGDTILVVEKNEFAVENWHGTANEGEEKIYHKEFNDTTSLEEGLEEIKSLSGSVFEEGKYHWDSRLWTNYFKKWEDYPWNSYFGDSLGLVDTVDEKNRPISSEGSIFRGFIRIKGEVTEYNDLNQYIKVLNEKFGENTIQLIWDDKRDKIEPKFHGDIEEYKDTENYESEKTYISKYKTAQSNIHYVDKAPEGSNFVRNIFEVDVRLTKGNKQETNKMHLAYEVGYEDFRIPDTYVPRTQYGAGQMYREYEKNGHIYRVYASIKNDVYFVADGHYQQFYYHDLYQPTRAYHISDKLTNIKNIYAKEEKEITESKGSVIVKYELVGGISIKENADVVEDAVVSSTETKYYLDKDNQKVIVGTPTTINKEVLYDTTDPTVKLQEITKNGKKYKLVGLKTGSPAETGKVASGTTEITYVYKLATAGNVFEKYMIVGTDTEIALEKQLTKEVSIGDAYTSTPPKAYTVIKKDGKSYIYKGHRSTSAPETGTVDETTKTVIYDFVELIAEKGEPDKQEELPEGVVSEKGEPEVQPALKDAVVTEKGEPEVQEELPEGVVTGKGDSTIHEIDKLIVTRHILKDEGFEILPTEKDRFKPEQDFVDNNGRHYQYIETKEHDGIITHYYKGIISNGNIKVTETTKQEELKDIEKSIKSNRLPNTGNNSIETIGLGVLSLLGAGIVRRKKENK